MWVNVSTSCKGALSLDEFLEIHLQKGSICALALECPFDLL